MLDIRDAFLKVRSLFNHSWAGGHVLEKITFIAFYNQAYITIILPLILIIVLVSSTFILCVF